MGAALSADVDAPTEPEQLCESTSESVNPARTGRTKGTMDPSTTHVHGMSLRVGGGIGFIVAQMIGAASAYSLSRYLWPRAVEPLPSVAPASSQRVGSAPSLAAKDAIDTVRRSS